MNNSAVISVQNLSISAGDVPLTHDVSFDLSAGKTLALVGESGSGKSITAMSIMRLLDDVMSYPTGRVMLGDVDLLQVGQSHLQTLRGTKIGMIFQEPMTSLNPLHTIGRQIAEAIELHNAMPKHAVQNRVIELLELVELGVLTNRLNAYPHELSGGQRQRVMIAMAVANHPDVLIADEPTTALDVTVQATILALLKRLQRELGMALLLITHDLSIVKHMADEVAVMKDGRIVEHQGVKSLFATPKHAYTKALMDAVPKGDPVSRTPQAPILEAHNMAVDYVLNTGLFGVGKRMMQAVKQVNIAVQRGQTVGIVGESGSGKTTLAMALLRLVHARGRIVFAGQQISELSTQQMRPLRQKLQVVFQDPFGSLNPRLTVGEIIAEGLRAHGVSGQDSGFGLQGGAQDADTMSAEPSAHEVARHCEGQQAEAGSNIINKVLLDVGLSPEMASRYPHEFSGGQRQRIAIARALVLEPELIVLDEPTSALDVSTQSSILKLLKKLQQERGLSYLFITHDLRVIKTIAHHIVVMKDGQVVESGENLALFDAPNADYTKRLLDAALA